MAYIKDEVKNEHLATYPNEEGLLRAFLNGFDINWAARRHAYNTNLSVYFLGPENFMKEMFGFDSEITLFISDFPTLEPRTMQAVEAILLESPAKGRVDQTTFFIISEDANARAWVDEYISKNPQSRIPIVFDADKLRRSAGDSWHIRNVLKKQSFTRDLFDYQLPLDNDLLFFGRDAIVADHFDAIKRSQNRGLFGLRKTGKTSILYKLSRLMRKEGLGAFLYYDCKLPFIRMMRWNGFLSTIINDIATFYKLERRQEIYDEKTVSREFLKILKEVPENKITALVFDEIEYVSPLAVDDVHWKNDFIPFWQTLWATQSQVRRLSNMIAGVNPKVVEIDVFGEVQNPMFGIFHNKYLKGMNFNETRGMVRLLGKRMGLTFNSEAYEYIHRRYGGHPLLTRRACSEIHAELEKKSIDRPIEIREDFLTKGEAVRESELLFYSRHVMSELSRFYRDEYEVLELMAGGQINSVMELSDDPELTRHLREYGIIDFNTAGRPHFLVPVLERYIGMESARNEGRKTKKKIIEANDRAGWIKNTVEKIVWTTKELIRLSKSKNLPQLFLDTSIPDAHKFISLSQVKSEGEFTSFINITNKCFVEAIETFGRSISKKDYLFNEIKLGYPDLFDALLRIKVYRHDDFHRELYPRWEQDYNKYISFDFEGRKPIEVPDADFIKQQCVLDSLLLALRCELNTHS